MVLFLYYKNLFVSRKKKTFFVLFRFWKIDSETREVGGTLLRERRLLEVSVFLSSRVGLVLTVGDVCVVLADALGEGRARAGLKALKGQASTSDLQKTHSVKYAFIEWYWKQLLFFVVAVLDFGPGQLTSRRFIQSWNARFYKPFILKVYPSIFRITSHTIMPGKQMVFIFHIR